MVSGLPPLLPWVASFLYLAVMAAHLYWGMGLCGDDVSPARTIALVGLLGLLIAAEPYAARPRLLTVVRWTPVALLAARVVLYEGVATLECAGFSKFLYLLVPFQAYFSLGRRAGYALGVLYFGILVARFSMQDPGWYLRDAYQTWPQLPLHIVAYRCHLKTLAADGHLVRGEEHDLHRRWTAASWSR